MHIQKARTNVNKSDLAIGDKVRIKISGLFSKSSDQQFCDEIYIVKKVDYGNITLDDNNILKTMNLLNISSNTATTDEPNLMKIAKKDENLFG